MRNVLKVLPVLLVIVTALAFVSNATATGVRGGCGCCVAAAPAVTATAPAAAAPAPVAAAPKTNVRSYSYEPSTRYYSGGRSSGNSGGFDALAPLRLKGVIR